MQTKRINKNLIWIILVIVLITVIVATCSITYADYINKSEGSSTAAPRGAYIADNQPINYYPQSTSESSFNFYLTNSKDNQVYPKNAIITLMGAVNSNNSSQIRFTKVEVHIDGEWQSVSLTKNGDTFSFTSPLVFLASKPSIQFFRIGFQMTWDFPLSIDHEAFTLQYSIEEAEEPGKPEGNYEVSLDEDKQVQLMPNKGSRLEIYTGDLTAYLQNTDDLVTETIFMDKNTENYMYINVYYNGHLQSHIGVYTETTFIGGTTHVKIQLKDNITGVDLTSAFGEGYTIKIYIPETLDKKTTINSGRYPY